MLRKHIFNYVICIDTIINAKEFNKVKYIYIYIKSDSFMMS